MVVAQLVERSPPTPEIRNSKPVKHIKHMVIVNCVEKTKIKKKRLGTAHFLVNVGKNDWGIGRVACR